MSLRWMVLAGLLIATFARAQSFEVQVDSWDVIVSKTATGLKFTVPAQAPGGLVSEPKLEASLPAPADETLEVSCSPVSPKLTQNILGKSVRKIALMWTCFLTNLGTESVLVSENSLLRHMGAAMPYDRQAFQLALANVAKYSALERIERLLADGTRLTALIGVAQFAAIPVALTLAATAFTAEEPYILSRLRGVEVPVMANYQALTNSSPIAPGNTAVYHIFGSPEAPARPIQFSITIGNLPKLRAL